MSIPVNSGPILKISTPAFALISGAVSGTTPKVSGWIELKDVDTFTVAITQGSGVNGVWSAKVATNSLGRDAKDLPNPPAWPSGVAATGTPTITMPGDEFYFLQLTFTPSAGSSTVVANAGTATSKPVSTAKSAIWGMGIYVPAADNLACDWTLEYSPNYDLRTVGGSTTSTPQFKNSSDDPAVWISAVWPPDPATGNQAAVAIPSAAGSGQKYYMRQQHFEPIAIRLKCAITGGFGHAQAWSNGKA